MDEPQSRFQDFAESPATPLRDGAAHPVVTAPQDLYFEHLEWKSFEQLCCRLVTRIDGVKGEPYLYGVLGQAQRGIDIVAHVRRGERLENWAFQCRRVKQMSTAGFERAVEELDYTADHFVVMVSSPAGTELQDAAEEQDATELWDSRILSRKLKAHPDIVADFFGPHWAAHFCVRLESGERSPADAASEYNRGETFCVPYGEAGFVGRHRELAELRDHLERSRSIALEGPGGIGKTQLLIRALERLDPGDGVTTIWIDAEGLSNADDTELVMQAAMRQLGLVVSPQGTLRVLHDAPLRIVLDGVEQAMQHGDGFADFLRRLLAETRTPQFIFTSQVELGHIGPEVQIRVEPLSANDSLRLLGERGGVVVSNSVQSRGIEDLADFAEGHPLTLQLIASQLRKFGTAQEVIERLEGVGTELLVTPGRSGQTRRTSLHLALALAYGWLTEHQRRTLGCLAHLPGGAFDRTIEMVVSGVDRALENSEGDVLDDLGELYRWHLVRRRVTGRTLRYRLLEPIRRFVLAELGAEETSEAKVIRLSIAESHAAWAAIKKHGYLQLGGNAERTSYGLSRFDDEIANYLAAVDYMVEDLQSASQERQEELHKALHFLVSGLTTYLFVRGHLERGVELLRLGIQSGCEIGHLNSEMFVMLIRVLSRMRDREGIRQALDEFREAVQTTENPDDKANFFLASADFAEANHEYEKAAAFYRKAEVIYQQLESQSERVDPASVAEDSGMEPGGLTYSRPYVKAERAGAIAQRGRMHEHIGDFPSALELGQEALQLLNECGDHINIPSTLFHIARAHEGLGDIAEALKSFVGASELFFELGTPQYLSNAVSEVGSLIVQHNSLDVPEMPEDLIGSALDDVLAEAIQALQSPPEAAWAWGGEVVRKSLCIVALASFRGRAEEVGTWGMHVREVVIRPFVGSGAATNPTPAAVVVRDLDMLATAALVIADMMSFDRVEAEDLRHVAALCRETVLVQTSGLNWLARWARAKDPERWSDLQADDLRELSEGYRPFGP